MHSLSFNSKQVNKHFPFFLTLKKDLKICAIGTSLEKLLVSTLGASFHDHFKIINKSLTYTSFDELRSLAEKPVHLLCLKNDKIILSGEFEYLQLSNELIFIGKPIFDTSHQLTGNTINNDVFDFSEFGQKRTSNYFAIDDLSKFKALSLVAEENINGIVFTDKSGNIVWVNNSFEITTGYSLEDAIGKRPRHLLYGEGSVYVKEDYVDENVLKRKPFAFENLGYTKNNFPFWFRAVVHPIINEQNEITGRFSIITDITEIKTRELKLKENQEAWEFALEGAGHGLWAWDIKNQFIRCSTEFKKLLGYNEEDVFESTDWHNALNTDDFSYYNNNIAPLLTRENSTFIHTQRFNCKDGNYRYFVTRGKIVEWDKDNSPSKSVGTLTDVNDFMVQKQALQETTKILSVLIENLNSGVLFTDTNRKIILANKYYCDMLSAKIKPEDIIGTYGHKSISHFSKLFKNPKEVIDNTLKLIKNGKKNTDELLLSSYGQTIERDFIPINSDNILTGYLWQFRDVSERKKFLYDLTLFSDKLHLLIDNLEEGIMLEDLDNNIFYVNQPFCNFLSPSIVPKLLLNSNTIKFLPEVSRLFMEPEAWAERVNTLLANREKITDEMVIMANGKILSRDFIPIISNNNVNGYLWKYKDVTEKNKLTTELYSTKEMLNMLLEHIQSGVLFENESGHIHFVNQHFCNLVNPSLIPADLIGKNTSLTRENMKHKFKAPQHFIERISELRIKNENVLNEPLEMSDGRVLRRDFIPIYSDGEKGYLWQMRDDTERAALISDLSLSTERLSRLVENLNEGILLEDNNRKIVLVNQQFCNFFKIPISHKDLIGQDCTNAAEQSKFLFSDPESFVKRITEILERKETIIDEILNMVNGHILSRDFIPVFNDGQYLGHLWKYRDITENVNNEKNLSSLKEYYQNILNEIPADIAILNADLNYEFLNKHSVKNDELRAWLIGKNDHDYCKLRNKNIDMANKRREIVEEIFNGKQPRKLIDENILQENDSKYTLRLFYPHINIDGKITYVIAYGVDITEQIKNEKYAIIQEKRIMNFMNIIKDGVFRCNADGSINLYNNSFFTIFDINLSEYETDFKLNFFHLLSTDELPKVKQKIELLYLTGESQFGMLSLTTRKGVEKYFDYTLTVAMSAEEAAFVCRITDITEIMNREKNLNELIIKEQELNNKKSSFIRITSHELRTPLSIILANTEILEIILANKSSNALIALNPETVVSRISKEVGNMTDILDQLMNISRIENNNIEFEPEVHNIYYFITILKDELFNPYIDGRSLLIECNPDIGSGLFDKKLLRLALINIINNAFKYSQGKPSPVLRAQIKNDSIIFDVKDFGIGIPSSEKSKLFNSFFRASNVGTISGTGLGLIVIDYSIKKHNGKVYFNSVEGKGTTFSISIPK